ncbi:MAG: carbohydrate-binding domain-containing protein, partial [Oscillospiraceae bacterium]|nr:carbohydrate-binding domain-containing protein [Oscillospiraceae bacterium]
MKRFSSSRRGFAAILSLALLVSLSATAFAASGDAVATYSEDTSVSGQTYVSTGKDENAILVTGGSVRLDSISVTRSSSDSTGGDDSSFYGVGAAILATGGTAYISGSTITTSAAGGAGVFAYGDGTIYIDDTTISTGQDTSGGIHVAGGGTLYAWDLDVTTQGESSAAIRSDHGSGTMVVDGGTCTSNGTGSPAVYSTADITVGHAELTANGSEAVCIEGLNSLRLFDCSLSGNMADSAQNDCTWNVILYQSMSGDSESGNSTFEMSGGTLTAANGGMFYTTNTESTFVLQNVEIVPASDGEFFLRCTGNANERGWGSTGRNGADCLFTAIAQSMEGDVVWDSISQLDFYMTDASALTGAFVQDESCAGAGGSGYANLYISSDSTWVVTADSTLSALYCAGSIVDADGAPVTIQDGDGTAYVSGTSAYTVTVGSYSDTADLSGAETADEWSDYAVDKPDALSSQTGSDDTDSTADLDGLTTFVFDGDSVTVMEGGDTNYEVVVYDDTDTESAADCATDGDGNAVYSLPDGSSGELLVSIKKKGGSYVFQGEGRGSIAVKKEATGDALLYLNGLTLTSSFTSVVTVKKDSTAACTIYAVEGTVNTLTDNAYNNDENHTDNAAAENAVMKFRDGSDVTLTGGGTIEINANGKNGIKADDQLTISGDVILCIDAAEDGINCENALAIVGGDLTLNTGANAIHADYTLNLGSSGGADSDLMVNIASCEEGLEGATINIYSGTYTISSSDDSINAANNDLTDYSYEMNIYGGSIYAASVAGDCLDSNGDITVTGGSIVALGALDNTEETNNALDCDGTLTVTGGTVLAVGMQEMSATPATGSQPYVTWTAAGTSTAAAAGGTGSDSGMQDGFAVAAAEDTGSGSSAPGMGDGGTPPDMNGGPAGGSGDFSASTPGVSTGFISNGDTLTISDSENNVLLSVTAAWESKETYSVDYVLFSSPDVAENSSYTLALNGETDGNTSDNSSSGSNSSVSSGNSGEGYSLSFDSTAWQYNSGADVYYQTGVVYCSNPYNTTYESLGLYVPAAYMNMTANGDGSYTFGSFTADAVGDYTAETAPIVIPVNTAGYAAQAAPIGFSSAVTTNPDEGIIYLYAGCRGRDTANGGAPWGVTDLKAAIRYYRANAAVLPGDTDSIFTFGHSGGGAQSAVVGASGDSELYYPYLYAIGAAGVEYDAETDTCSSSISDATCGAMCWCPITSLDYADAAYEWMMGQYASTGTRADGKWTAELSDDLSEAFAEYINSLTLVDADGNALTLAASDDGIYVSGSYYDYLLSQIEYSLNDFIDAYTDEDGNFSYSASSGSGGTMPGRSTAATSGGTLEDYLLTLDENYGTSGAWISYDAAADWYCISSVEDFVLYGSKQASKDVGAFDDLSTSQAENYVFGNGSGTAAHFDSLMAALLAENYAAYAAADSSVSESDILAYAAAYQDDYDSYTTDSLLGYSSQYRQNMYNPMYYLCQDYAGYGASSPAAHWRINTGITQSDTSLTVEMNLYLTLLEDIGDGTVESVDFATLWAQGHTTAERAGADSDACFIAWISDCMTGAAANADTDSGDDTGSTPGDLTGDGSVDASDLTILARHVGKVEYITDETALAN